MRYGPCYIAQLEHIFIHMNIIWTQPYNHSIIDTPEQLINTIWNTCKLFCVGKTTYFNCRYHNISRLLT